MVDAFTPSKPEEMIVVKITKKEAVLLTKLRRYAFGKFLIHKVNGVPIRIEINDTQLLEDDTPVDLS